MRPKRSTLSELRACETVHIRWASFVGTGNIWIAKPSGKSRGRGIALFRSAATVMEYVRGSQEHGWVVQKYIERPLLVHGHKFDIRQWVLVTSWAPLQAWFYDDCYLRFAAARYSTADLSIGPHLSNNSVTKGAHAPNSGALPSSVSVPGSRKKCSVLSF